MEQQRIHYTEHGGIGANAQGQRQHRHCGEAGALTEHAQAVAKIVQQSFHISLKSLWVPHLCRFCESGIRYSYLSATMGSTFVARRAGIKLASSADATSTAATTINVHGSRGLTPKSSPASNRVAATLASRPAATPARATRIPCPTTRRIGSRAFAPSAMRNPISCMRWLTE